MKVRHALSFLTDLLSTTTARQHNREQANIFKKCAGFSDAGLVLKGFSSHSRTE
jgi:hypothetical protein